MRNLILITFLCVGMSSAALAQEVLGSGHEVYFSVGSAALNKATTTTLDGLVARLKKAGSTSYEVLVYGYADPTGNAKLNMELSIKRINSVADYLEKQGISKERIVRQIPRGDEQTRSKYVNTEKDLSNDKRRSVELIITPSINKLDPAGAPAAQ
jgi:outer membrane protein OmpA-like peptidoglycan-associated protein